MKCAISIHYEIWKQIIIDFGPDSIINGGYANKGLYIYEYLLY